MRSRLLLPALILAVSAGCYAPQTGTGPLPEATKPSPTPTVSATATRPAPANRCEVQRTVDGDTVHLACRSGRVIVRVIGLDTPETKDPRKPVQCFGPEASAEAARLLPAGRSVTLVADPTQGGVDKYQRTLGYLTLANGTDYGGYMIRHGFGHEYTYRKPYQRQQAYKLAESRAKTARLGLWGRC